MAKCNQLTHLPFKGLKLCLFDFSTVHNPNFTNENDDNDYDIITYVDTSQ